MSNQYRIGGFIRIIICLLLVSEVKANSVGDTINPVFEMNRIMSTLSNANHLSFNSVLYYENRGASGISRDTLSAQYKINGQQYYLNMGSAEIIQNAFYNLTVNKSDSVLVLARPKALFTSVLQFDMLDPTMRGNYLSSMAVVDSGSTRRLSLIFKNNTPYISFDLVYDVTTYYIKQVTCRMRSYIITDPVGQAGLAGYYTQVQQVYSNYQSGAFTDSSFATDPYFIRQNGQFITVAPYTRFDIINQTLNK